MRLMKTRLSPLLSGISPPNCSSLVSPEGGLTESHAFPVSNSAATTPPLESHPILSDLPVDNPSAPANLSSAALSRSALLAALTSASACQTVRSNVLFVVSLRNALVNLLLLVTPCNNNPRPREPPPSPPTPVVSAPSSLPLMLKPPIMLLPLKPPRRESSAGRCSTAPSLTASATLPRPHPATSWNARRSCRFRLSPTINTRRPRSREHAESPVMGEKGPKSDGRGERYLPAAAATPRSATPRPPPTLLPARREVAFRRIEEHAAVCGAV